MWCPVPQVRNPLTESVCLSVIRHSLVPHGRAPIIYSAKNIKPKRENLNYVSHDVVSCFLSSQFLDRVCQSVSLSVTGFSFSLIPTDALIGGGFAYFSQYALIENSMFGKFNDDDDDDDDESLDHIHVHNTCAFSLSFFGKGDYHRHSRLSVKK